jgi:hypothetical protein
MDALPNNLLETLLLDLRFRELMECLHFDDSFPENKNIRTKSAKRGFMEIYRNNKWNIGSFVKGLDEMNSQRKRIFNDFCSTNKEKLTEDVLDEKDLAKIVRELEGIP